MGLNSMLLVNSVKCAEDAAMWHGASDAIPPSGASLGWMRDTGCVLRMDKASWLHRWAVERASDSDDVNGNVLVDVTEDLPDLLERVEMVLLNRSAAKSMLPTRSGLFFGPTDYGEGYMRQVEDVRDFLRWFLSRVETTGSGDGSWRLRVEYSGSW